jgi:recombination-promoting nuclease RpnB
MMRKYHVRFCSRVGKGDLLYLDNSRSLEHPAIARAFFRQHTLAYLKEEVDWEGLSRIDRNDTDPTLKKLQRDIIYKAPLKQGGNIILGVEHQSKADPLMPIRYLRYSANVFEVYIKEGHTKWPLLVTFLVYNGLKSPYPYPLETTDFYEHGIWGNKELYLRLLLIDLLQISDQEILSHGLCAPVELLLKHSRDGKFEMHISAYRKIFHDCIREVGEDYIYSMLAYTDSLKDFKIGEKLHKFIEEIFQDKSDIVMTYGQLLKREAKLEGKIEGILEGKIEGSQSKAMEVAKRMLNKGADITFIKEITGLSKATIIKLKQE